MIFRLLSTLVVNHGEAPRRSFGLGQIERNLLVAEVLKVGLYQHQSSDPSHDRDAPSTHPASNSGGFRVPPRYATNLTLQSGPHHLGSGFRHPSFVSSPHLAEQPGVA